MKMMYDGTQIKSLNVKHFEVDTNSATVQPSDLQAGVTCFGRGKKITGTGKSFEFASYGALQTNIPDYIPSLINVIEITSLDYPIRSLISFRDMQNIDFSVEQNIGNVSMDNNEYPITVKIENNIITFNCEKSITLQFFYGKDNYT